MIRLRRGFEDADDRASLALVDLGATYLLDLRDNQVQVAEERIRESVGAWNGRTPMSLKYLGVLGEANLALYRGQPEAVLRLLKKHWFLFVQLNAYQNARINRAWLYGAAQLMKAQHAPKSVTLAKLLRAATAILQEDAPWGFGFAHILRAAGVAIMSNRVNEGQQRHPLRHDRRSPEADDKKVC